MSSDDRWVLAFDVGGQTTKVAVVSERGRMERWRRFPTHPHSRELFLERLIGNLCALQDKSSGPIVGIAGSVAGFISEAGVMTYNANLAWLEGTGIGDELMGRFRLPVHLENDANAACAGEYVFGAGEGSRRFLSVTGGTGIGVAMIAEGSLLRPAFAGLGDAGHVIVLPDGPGCSCGGRGCAEALLSTVALGQMYGKLLNVPRSFRDLVAGAHEGGVEALAVLEQAGHWLGIALATLAHIFFPDRIAIAGGLAEAGEALLGAARASFRAHGGSYPVSLASVVGASTGAHAPLLGAAACLFSPGLSRRRLEVTRGQLP